MSREMTEPESLVWAVAFVVGLKEAVSDYQINELPIADQPVARRDHATERAHQAVSALRQVRVRGRDEQPAYRMLRDFRMDDLDARLQGAPGSPVT